jgi:hypothetical protein
MHTASVGMAGDFQMREYLMFFCFCFFFGPWECRPSPFLAGAEGIHMFTTANGTQTMQLSSGFEGEWRALRCAEQRTDISFSLYADYYLSGQVGHVRRGLAM